MAFIDLRKAYPSVPRDVLFRILEKFGIPSHFRQVLQRFYTDLTVRVDFGSEDPLEMPAGRTGLREGCRLSPILWLFVIQCGGSDMLREWVRRTEPQMGDAMTLLS